MYRAAPPASRLVVALLAGAVVLAMDTSAQGPARADLSGVVRVDGRPRPDVVVWLDGLPAEPAAARPRVVLDQRNLAFAPRVLAVRVGTRVEMPNNDRVFHNVFSFKDGKRFDLGLYPSGTMRVVEFDRPGLSRIFCNIHPNMAAYVLAVDAAHFAVTDRDGRFTLRGVPAGRVSYRAWRPGAEERVGVAETRTSALEIAWP